MCTEAFSVFRFSADRTHVSEREEGKVHGPWDASRLIVPLYSLLTERLLATLVTLLQFPSEGEECPSLPQKTAVPIIHGRHMHQHGRMEGTLRNHNQ